MHASTETKLKQQISVDWESVIEVLGEYLEPEDVFPVEALQGWAEDNGYVKA